MTVKSPPMLKGDVLYSRRSDGAAGYLYPHRRRDVRDVRRRRDWGKSDGGWLIAVADGDSLRLSTSCDDAKPMFAGKCFSYFPGRSGEAVEYFHR